VIPREELLTLVWPGVVVGDDALTQAIIKLRKALGDDAQEPRYIETIRNAVSPDRFGSAVALRAFGGIVDAGAQDPGPRRRHCRHRGARGGGHRHAPRPARGHTLAARDRCTGAHPRGSYPLVAVLPLANQSGDPGRDYLSDGLTEDIIGALGRFSGLRVMSWNAVQGFKGKEPQAETIRSTLRARYVVRGSVREAQGSVRVAVELSDAEKGTQLWSEKYDGQGAQLFEIQDRMVRSIVGALAVKLRDIEQQRSTSRPTQSAEAYDLVLQARALMRVEKRKENREAKELLVRAQKLAPEYAEVWVALGENEWNRAAYGWIEDPAEGIGRSEALSRRALELSDPAAHARAYSLLATLKTHTGQAEEGLAHALKALQINPSDAGSLFRQGHAQLVLGRAEEAIATFEYAMRLEPRPSQGPQLQLAMAYYMAGRYRDAVSYADVLIALRPEGGSIRLLRAAALAQLGDIDAARKSAEEALRRNPRLNLEEAGSRFHRPEDAAKLREGLAKAGL
jgi:TolB-like protein